MSERNRILNKKSRNNDKKVKVRGSLWVRLMLELFVVFLGVTAGFVLNNWRMDLQERRLEEKFIVGFVHDLEFNIEELETQIEQDSLWLERATPLILSMVEGTFSEESALVILFLMGSSSRVTLHKSTYDDMTGSGNLGIIRDFEKRKSIVDYNTEMDQLRFVEEHFDGFFSDFVLPFYIQKVNCIDGVIHPIFDSSGELNNLFYVYYSIFIQRNSAYRGFLEMSVELKEKLSDRDERR